VSANKIYRTAGHVVSQPKPKHVKIIKLNNLQCEAGDVNNKMLCYNKSTEAEDPITSTIRNHTVSLCITQTMPENGGWKTNQIFTTLWRLRF
jgi:hypothetical protein